MLWLLTLKILKTIAIVAEITIATIMDVVAVAERHQTLMKKLNWNTSMIA